MSSIDTPSMLLTFESLPNELYLVIFSYLPSRHTWRAFFELNARFTQLLTSGLLRHTIDLQGISYAEIVELLDDHVENSHHRRWQSAFVRHADAICLANKFDYEILFDGWLRTEMPWQLSSLRVCRVLVEAVSWAQLGHLYAAIKPLIRRGSELPCLHLVFDDPHYGYYWKLSGLVYKRISFPTMIVEAKRGLQHQRADRNDDLYDIKHPLCWMHTVRLTLHLQHAAELVLLLSPDALPLLEHLNVTIEQPQKDLPLRIDQSTKRYSLSKEDLVRANADSTKLRSLVVHQIRLDELVILLGALTYPRLCTLTLVDVWDQDLRQLLAFQQAISSCKLSALVHDRFQFLLRFPAHCEREWIRRYQHAGWPFDATTSYLDERVEERDYHYPSDALQSVLLVMSVPFNVLKHVRTVHNHALLAHHQSTDGSRKFARSNIEWLWKWTGDKAQLAMSLKGLNNVEMLHCVSVGVGNPPELGLLPEPLDLCHRLRSLTFRFIQHVPRCSPQYCSPLQIILDASPRLAHLNVEWQDFSRCSAVYPNIVHAEVTVYRQEQRASTMNQLDALIPRVNHLAIGGHQLVREEPMVKCAVRVLGDGGHFVHLTLLQINKNGRIAIKPHVKTSTKEAIRARVDRLKDPTTTRVEFSYHNELNMWLR